MFGALDRLVVEVAPGPDLPLSAFLAEHQKAPLGVGHFDRGIHDHAEGFVEVGGGSNRTQDFDQAARLHRPLEGRPREDALGGVDDSFFELREAALVPVVLAEFHAERAETLPQLAADAGGGAGGDDDVFLAGLSGFLVLEGGGDLLGSGLEPQASGADFDEISRAQSGLAGVGAVHPRAVLGPHVEEFEAPLGAGFDPAVVLGDEPGADPQIVVLGPSDGHRVFREGEELAATAVLHDDGDHCEGLYQRGETPLTLRGGPGSRGGGSGCARTLDRSGP